MNDTNLQLKLTHNLIRRIRIAMCDVSVRLSNYRLTCRRTDVVEEKVIHIYFFFCLNRPELLMQIILPLYTTFRPPPPLHHHVNLFTFHPTRYDRGVNGGFYLGFGFFLRFVKVDYWQIICILLSNYLRWRYVFHSSVRFSCVQRCDSMRPHRLESISHRDVRSRHLRHPINC